MKKGMALSTYAKNLIGQNESELENIISQFESSYKHSNESINVFELPELNDVIDALSEICQTNNITRIIYFIDEAAHVFRPEQQRQFFSLFRDLKSPQISCKASVYPGVTHYGNSFEMTHDAIPVKLERNIMSDNYISDMKTMVVKQGIGQWESIISNNGNLFSVLAFAAGGNPRLLLKTLEKCRSKLTTQTVGEVVKTFYLTDIWAEHTQIGEKYKGLKQIVDWGRSFIEDSVLKDTLKKNTDRLQREKKEATVFFWVSKDCPEPVKESLRLLSYTGIVRKNDSGVKATKSKIGDRYEIKFGCLLSLGNSPSTDCNDIIDNIKLDMFTEYGANNLLFTELTNESVIDLTDSEFIKGFNHQLTLDIETLDLTRWSKQQLKSIGVITIRDLLEVTEDRLKTIPQIGEVRSRTMKNIAMAEILETISG